MPLITTLLQGASIALFLWISRSYIRKVFIRSPLDNIPGPPPVSFWKGNLGQLFDRHGWQFQKEIGEKYGSVLKISGFFGDKWLYVFDPKALHNIIVKDQYVYEETPLFLTGNRLVFGEGLLATLGDHHRHQRKILNPVFSISHMRHMLPIFYQVTHNLRKALTARVENGPKEIDMLDWMTRTALELVGQGGLGYSFDPLVEDIANPCGDAIKALVPTVFPMIFWRTLLPFLAKIGSPTFRRRILECIPDRRLQRVREISDILHQTAKEILESKRAAMAAGDEAVLRQVGEGKDIMSVLLQANMAANEEDRLPDHELLGHMTTLIFAAMDTTSGALAHILHMLAQHQDAQNTLRREIEDARHGGQDISYDSLVALPYLDAVCRETLRLYAPLSFVQRTTRKDVVMPLSEPIRGKDGSLMSELAIPNNTRIIIGILQSNRNRTIWGEDAYEWKPERWLSPLPEAVTDAHIPGVYSNLMTFLGGGRACIGFKFSQLEMKVVLSVLLETFKIELPEKEIYWNVSGIQYPTVGPNGTKASMPLRVSLLKST